MRQKPFLKWAGGKHKLVPFIEHYFPKQKRKRLVEPFCGSAALSLATEFEAYLLNDINPDLIGLFQILKTEKHAFIEYAGSFFQEKYNQEKYFYALREQFNNTKNPIERLALLLYLNRHAFNGLCRYNSQGQFNAPFGRYKNPYFPVQEMQAYIAKSERIALMREDFSAVFLLIQSGDCIYCDPPYVPLSKTASFTAYAQNGFNLDEQQRLADCAESVIPRAQSVVISNHDTAWVRHLYRNAYIESLEVQRNIAAKGKSRQKVSELLAVYGMNT